MTLAEHRPQPTVEIDGIGIFAGSRGEAIQRCQELIRSGRGGRVATVNLDFLALARNDALLRQHLNESTLAIADGMPVVWLGRMAGARQIERLPGVDLVRELCSQPSAQALRVAIYGSTTAICGAAARHLETLAPGLEVCLTISPPFRPLSEPEMDEHLGRIVSSAPDVVLVALGCPGQERLIAKWHRSVPRAVWIGVGGTLDFYAGQRRRAPRWLQRAGLEWVVRLVQEPRRLTGRYLLRDIPALARLAPACLAARLTR